MENGGRERDRGSESDEGEDSEQNTSDTGRLEDSTEHSQMPCKPMDSPSKNSRLLVFVLV